MLVVELLLQLVVVVLRVILLVATGEGASGGCTAAQQLIMPLEARIRLSLIK